MSAPGPSRPALGRQPRRPPAQSASLAQPPWGAEAAPSNELCGTGPDTDPVPTGGLCWVGVALGASLCPALVKARPDGSQGVCPLHAEIDKMSKELVTKRDSEESSMKEHLIKTQYGE